MASLSAVVITISDRCFTGEREDLSGPALIDFLLNKGWVVIEKIIINDDLEMIVDTLQKIKSRDDVDLILTTGGTGLSPRDNTPEATKRVIQKEIPGLVEKMRALGREITPFADLSRAIAGTVGTKVILNLPGSPKGAIENLESVLEILPHALSLLKDNSPH